MAFKSLFLFVVVMTDGRKVFFGVEIIIFKLSDRNCTLFQTMLNGVLRSEP